MRTIFVTEEDVQTLIKIAVNYKATLDLIVKNSKIIPYSDITGIKAHYDLYNKVKHLCEEAEEAQKIKNAQNYKIGSESIVNRFYDSIDAIKNIAREDTKK